MYHMSVYSDASMYVVLDCQMKRQLHNVVVNNNHFKKIKKIPFIKNCQDKHLLHPSYYYLSDPLALTRLASLLAVTSNC